MKKAHEMKLTRIVFRWLLVGKHSYLDVAFSSLYYVPNHLSETQLQHIVNIRPVCYGYTNDVLIFGMTRLLTLFDSIHSNQQIHTN